MAVVNNKLAILAVFALSVGLLDNAYAHTEQVVGDYKIDVSWAKSPSTVGKSNSIEILVTTASASDKVASSKMMTAMKGMTDEQMANMDHGKMSDSGMKMNTMKSTSKSNAVKKPVTPQAPVKSSGITGLKLDADITINGKKTMLKLVEDKKTKGKYSAAITPMSEGSPIVHIVGKIKNTPIEISFHPEKIIKPAK